MLETRTALFVAALFIGGAIARTLDASAQDIGMEPPVDCLRTPDGSQTLASGQLSEQAPMPGAMTAPARDGSVAICEELVMAARKNTPAAYRLFIERHPDSPLVPLARQLLEIVRTPVTN